MNLLSLGMKSLINRRGTAILTLVTIAISVALLLGVEKVRDSARSSFASTISGADLVVGARTGAVQLLLYSVFRIGNATNNITWESYREIADRPGVDWTIPLSLGDSHRGFRVLGTNDDYLRYYQYGNRHSLEIAQGSWFADLFDVVLGAEVAAQLGYEIGQEIVLAHGAGSVSFIDHGDKPFRVSGILARTGTPVDRTLHVSLQAIEAIHVDWQQGVKLPGMTISAETVSRMELEPTAITAFVLGLQNRMAVFGLQRYINEYRAEPLLAILPGVALQELWGMMSTAEKALLVVSSFVIFAAFTGMIAVSLAGLNERRREISVLRALGAGYRHITALLVLESLLLTLAGVGLGVLLLYAGLWFSQTFIASQYGLYLPVTMLSAREWLILGIILLCGGLAGFVPALKAYRNALIDGLSART